MKYMFYLALLLLAGCAVTTTQQCQLPDEKVRSSVVRITALDGSTASGVIIAKNRVLTVAHAVEDATSAMVEVDGKFQVATVLGTDTENDLALLSVATSELAPMPVSRTLLRESEAVWAIGYPLALEQKMSLGLYQNMFNGRLYTSAHINSGSSGGGLLRCQAGNFELAGVVHGYVAQRAGTNYVNIGDSTSVPARKIKDFVSLVDKKLPPYRDTATLALQAAAN
ncbi:MAG: trypsin-like peptidase domain-containing protein [Pseudomonadales bacterium]